MDICVWWILLSAYPGQKMANSSSMLPMVFAAVSALLFLYLYGTMIEIISNRSLKDVVLLCQFKCSLKLTPSSY